jgi:hypothetical protein
MLSKKDQILRIAEQPKITVRMAPEIVRELKKRAILSDKTLSELVRDVVQEYLERAK